MSDRRKDIKTFILEEFLPGEDPKELTDDTPLVTSGILDSLATVRLVAFLEERYGIELEPHETDARYLDSIALIDGLVSSKL